MQLESLYKKIGGESVVHQLVENLYLRVLRDPQLSPFFSYETMEQLKHHQTAFLAMAFGGGSAYKGNSLRAAHAPLIAQGLTDRHFDILVRHFDGVMRELNIDSKLRTEALSLIEITRSEVMNQPLRS